MTANILLMLANISAKKINLAVYVISLHLHTSWIISCMRKADKNGDNMMSLKELKHFLRQINVDVSDVYAEELFNVSPSLFGSSTLYLKTTNHSN